MLRYSRRRKEQLKRTMLKPQNQDYKQGKKLPTVFPKGSDSYLSPNELTANQVRSLTGELRPHFERGIETIYQVRNLLIGKLQNMIKFISQKGRVLILHIANNGGQKKIGFTIEDFHKLVLAN